MSRWIRLGIRLSLGSGRAGALRTVLMSSGAALGVLIVLSCLSAVSVATAQQQRAQARTPQYAEEGVPASAPLRIIEIDDAIGDRPLRRTAVAGVVPGGPRPPGVAALPQPGEAVVSPALADLIRTDTRARERFPQRVVGTIGDIGLIAPDELWAYVGVRANDPHLRQQHAVLGFGAPLRAGFGSQLASPDVFTPARITAVAFALFALVPLGVFLATCARLSASTRDRKIAALRLLGVSARQAALVNAVETGVVAIGGALLGVAAYAALAPLSPGWRIGRLHWFAADLTVPAAWLAAVLLTTVGYAVTVGVLATRSARVAPLAVRRGAPARRPGWWRTLPLLGGLVAAALAGIDPLRLDTTDRGYLLVTGLLVSGLGVPLALPALSYALAGLIRRVGRAPVWLELAAARIRHTPAVAPRLVASLAVSLYVVGVGSVGVAAMANDTALMQSSGDQRLVYQTSGYDRGLTAELRRVPGIEALGVAVLEVTIAGEPAYALVAECAEVNRMFVVTPAKSCVDGGAYRLAHDLIGQPNAPAADAPAVGADGLDVPVLSRTLRVEERHGAGTAAFGSLLLTRGSPLLGGRNPEVDLMTVVAQNPVAAERAARLVAARTPANLLSGHYAARQGFDSDLLLTILTAGLTVSFILCVGAFAVAAVDRTMERRRDSASLSVVGVSPRLVTASEVGFGGLPLAIGLVTAGLSAVVITASLARLLGVDAGVVLNRFASTLWLGAGALVVGLALIAVPAGVTQRITAEQLRRQ
ncbi:FtsX-like permease family protein [Micromonospora sp. KC606]|uniref:FtsX-like permease family protein n=1 Tax=Micromonospora sp. KC606 TaxID=2530379 RepID=UPI001047C00D|nr:FtsX-like permease family protein [Micromonospora sp. KC606]TDC83068.1 FtsX-like permease family protein [Micromonospora sp. KC606]